MARWERVGVFREFPDRFRGIAEGIEEDRETIGVYTNPAHDQDMRRTIDLNSCMNAVLLQHFEAEHPLGGVRPYAEKVVSIALDYFFGPWRDAYKSGRKTMNRAQCRKKLEWVKPYREGLLCALLLDDREATLRLADWPDTDVNKEDLDYSPADIDYQIVLARHLKGRPAAESEKLIAGITAGSKRRPKLLLAALQAIQEGDAAAFGPDLTKYLQHFRKSEAELDELQRSVGMDASILWQVARQAGMALPGLPADSMDLIVTRESAGVI